MFVVMCNEFFDLGYKLCSAAERASANSFFRDMPELALHLVEPRGVSGGGVVHDESRMVCHTLGCL